MGGTKLIPQRPVAVLIGLLDMKAKSVSQLM
jgi:hypothetical protein